MHCLIRPFKVNNRSCIAWLGNTFKHTLSGLIHVLRGRSWVHDQHDKATVRWVFKGWYDQSYSLKKPIHCECFIKPSLSESIKSKSKDDNYSWNNDQTTCLMPSFIQNSSPNPRNSCLDWTKRTKPWYNLTTHWKH